MPIDECPHNFEYLVDHSLPKLLDLLQERIAVPHLAALLLPYKSATKKALKELRLASDISGCYVFIENAKPIYVGISRKLVKRLTQHLNHKSHYSASLVYKMASQDNPHSLRRSQAMKDEKFERAFLKRQSHLRELHFAFIEIQDLVTLYLFELFACMHFDTSKWNTFKTH